MIEAGDYSAASGAAAMHALIDRSPELDAVFAASDRMALGFARTLHARGYRVGVDVLGSGFDDSPAARE